MLCKDELLFIPDNFGVLADDVKLEHISALHVLYQPERHLQGETESTCDQPIGPQSEQTAQLQKGYHPLV